MPATRTFVRIVQNLNHKSKTKLLLYNYELFKGSFIPVLFFSDKKSSFTGEDSKVICNEEIKPSDVCVKVETRKLLSRNDPAEPIPKDRGKPKVDTSTDASLRPYVNPCPPYPPCDPCTQPVHPCREKPPRIPVVTDDVQEELSMRTRKILLALSALIGGIIIYKVLNKPDEPVTKAGKPKKPRCVLRPQYITKTPENHGDIPNDVPYLIIGGGTAAFSAFRTIKSLDASAKILVITEEPYNPYMRPPLAKDLVTNPDRNMSKDLRIPTGERERESRSIFYEPDEFFTPLKEFDTSENGGIFVVKGWSVDRIDPDMKTVSIKGGSTIKYNKCLLATGSQAKNISVFQFNTDDVAEKVTSYRTIYDYMEIEDVINCGAQKIAIIGGNNVACELASSLATRGIEVIQVFKESGVLSKLLPSYLSEWVTKKMEKEGVKVMKNTAIDDAVVTAGKLKLITKQRKCMVVDHAVVVSGFKPKTCIAEQSGLELDKCMDGFVANAEMQVRTDLYAAGDCVSFFDPKLGKRRRLQNHDNAITTGRIAGENMVGAAKAYDKESAFWSSIMPGIEFESIGIVDSKMATVGVFLDKENVKKVFDTAKKKLEPTDEYNRGVLFYLCKQKVMGIAMWNLVGRVSIAQRILRSNVAYEQLDESAKLFAMHVP